MAVRSAILSRRACLVCFVAARRRGDLEQMGYLRI